MERVVSPSTSRAPCFRMTRPKYRRLSGRPRVTDKGIERAFARYREFAGLAFWLTLTKDWLTQQES